MCSRKLTSFFIFQRYHRDVKQVKISAFFSTLEKPTEIHGKLIKSKNGTYKVSGNREPSTVKDILTLKCHSSKSKMDSDKKCNNEARNPLRVPNSSVTESYSLHENNSCDTDSMETVIKTNSSNLDLILPTPEHTMIKNKRRKVGNRMKRKLTFVDNVAKENKVVKCIQNYDLERTENYELSIVVAAQREEPRQKHMNISDNVKKCSKNKSCISDGYGSIFDKCFNRQDGDTNDDDASKINTVNMKFEEPSLQSMNISSGNVGKCNKDEVLINDEYYSIRNKCLNVQDSDTPTCEINTGGVKCETSDLQTENKNTYASDKIELALSICEQDNISDINHTNNNNVQLNLIENRSVTHGAYIEQDDCVKSSVNRKCITSYVAETETKVNTSEIPGSQYVTIHEFIKFH